MRNSNSKTQEGSDRPLIEDINQIKYISLGEGAATCQVYGSPLREGEAVVVYVFRPAEEEVLQIGCVLCGGEGCERPGEFTLGVRELLVEGRIGVCSGEVAESSWRVLVDPAVVAVSAAATKSVRLIPDGGSPTNGASDVEESGSPEASLMVSRGEAGRRADRPHDDVIRGLFSGGQR